MPEKEMPIKPEVEIPKELIEAVQSDDTASKIAEICAISGIEKEDEVQKIAFQVGRVLMGALSPKDFSTALKKEVKLSAFVADKVTVGIREIIFEPRKESLIKLYGEEANLSIKSIPEIPTKKTEKKKAGKDIYREPIE